MAKSKIGPDGWPEATHEPLDFTAISRPLVKALRFCFNLKRKNQDKDVAWSGPNIGKAERACCFDPSYALSAKNLAYSNDEQGRRADEEIIGLAIQLGIEQGRRLFRDSPEYSILVMKAAKADYEAGKITEEEFTKAITKGGYDVFN